ncbi:MAG TPA: hypothetical protein VNL73_05190 [Verrucomicrobiae bacterium]|nr:hypothetical protein [Verrucomicrobiae bacterium]
MGNFTKCQLILTGTLVIAIGCAQIPNRKGDATGPEQCGPVLSGQLSGVEVPANDSLFAYMSIMRNEEVILVGDTVKLENFQSSPIVKDTTLQADISTLSPGNYQVFYHVCENEQDVGVISKRLFSLGPLPTFVTAAGPSIPLLFGDTLRLKVVNVDTAHIAVEPSSGRSDVGDVPSVWLLKGGLYQVYQNSDGSYIEIVGAHIQKSSARAAELSGKQRKCTAEIDVKRPIGLGNTNNSLDGLIIDVANEFWIPPQILKAQVDQESKFDLADKGYRYELKNIDENSLQGSGHLWKLTSDPYKRYVLAGKNSSGFIFLFDGDSIQFLPENQYTTLQYRSSPDVVISDIHTGDGLGISAWDLWDQNPNLGWETRPGSDFTAQVVVAASYGLLHMTYVTAADEASHIGYGNLNPQRMFTNDRLGLTFGAKWVRYLRDYYGTSFSDWNLQWKTALGKYNGGKGAPQNSDGTFIWSSAQNYVDFVWGKVSGYEPW